MDTAVTRDGQRSDTSGNRLRLFDTIRGFSVVSMVFFHFCYDLKFIAGHDYSFFAPPLQDVWRASISWTFLFVAGVMCSLSRNNLRRAARYGVVAIAVYVVTSIVSVDVPISFGIIYCMAASTFVVWLLERVGKVPKGPCAALVLFVCFLCLQQIQRGVLGFGPMSVALPRWPYKSGLFSWLGMPGPTFDSGDYYPLLPYTCLYLAGTAMGAWWKERGFPQIAYEWGCAPLEAVGHHSLLVYVIHQPILLGIVSMIG